MADTSIYLKNYRDLRKKSILIILFEPVLSFLNVTLLNPLAQASDFQETVQ